MNFLDIILICIGGIFLIRGFFRGLVQEILSLIAIVLAIYLSSNYQHLLVPHLELYITSDVTVSALSYVTIFFGTLIVFWLLAKLLRSVLEISLLGWIDRAAGALFGAIEGALI
ncbi:CvpA family protein, partial [Pseudodesulfovibrio sp.]|nr:CvpA family protein [Pseudodesulfovibrio sp.]